MHDQGGIKPRSPVQNSLLQFVQEDATSLYGIGSRRGASGIIVSDAQVQETDRFERDLNLSIGSFGTARIPQAHLPLQ
jgi:hypothetical protein